MWTVLLNINCFVSRLRALSDGNTVASPPPTPSLGKFKLAEYRYGREEMLALFHEKYDTPPDLLACPSVCTEETQKPLALIALSEEEQVSAIVWGTFLTKHAVSSYIKSLRQEKWNNETHNKWHSFQPLIGITP